MKRILVVDDDPEIRDSLGIYLETEGYACELAATAEEARSVCSAKKLDLILLDYMLPKVNGAQFCSRLRKEGNLTPVLILSADRDIVRKAKDCGADWIVKKPFELDELIASIQRLTESSFRFGGRSGTGAWLKPA